MGIPYRIAGHPVPRHSPAEGGNSPLDKGAGCPADSQASPPSRRALSRARSGHSGPVNSPRPLCRITSLCAALLATSMLAGNMLAGSTMDANTLDANTLDANTMDVPAQTVAPQAAEPPLTFAQALSEAMAHNLDLAADRLQLPVAEAQRITARLRPNPVLTVSGQTLNLLGANFGPSSPLGPNQMNIHTELPWERGGKRQRRLDLADQEVALAEWQLRESLRQTLAATADAFVNVQQAKENLQLAQQNLASLESVVTINTARNRAGDLAAVELERSKLAALEYRTAVEQAQLQLDQAKLQLQQLLGRRTRSANFDVAGPLRREGPPAPERELFQQALARRPDYLAAKAEVARSQADLRLQLANGKADFTVGTEFTRQAASGIAGNTMGLYFSMPLAVNNRNQGEIARAQRQATLAAARQKATEAALESEIALAYRQYEVAQQLLANVERDVLGRARSVRETTAYSYNRGEASLLEFLDAQRAFNDAMQAYNDARANFARALHRLDSATASTLQTLPTPSPGTNP